MNGDSIKIVRWTYCFWEEKYNFLHELTPASGNVYPGVLFFPPPMGELTLAEGLWGELNDKLGTSFDYAEEESFEIEDLSSAALIIQNFSGRMLSHGLIAESVVGHRLHPAKEPIIAAMRSSDLSYHLNLLAEFLLDALAKRKVVVVSL